MSLVAIVNGLMTVLRGNGTIDGVAGLRSVTLGQPTGPLDLPGVYLVFGEFSRPGRNPPPAHNLNVMEYQIGCRLIIQWVDNHNAEQQLLALLDAIPDAIDANPRLNGGLSHGYAYIASGISGFATIGGVDHR